MYEEDSYDRHCSRAEDTEMFSQDDCNALKLKRSCFIDSVSIPTEGILL